MRAWWRRRTLRFRLAAWYAAGGTLLLAAFCGTLYMYVADTMARPLDFELREDLGEIRRRLAVTAEGELRWDGRPVRPVAEWSSDDPWFELWDEKGQLVRRFWPFTESRVESLPVAPEPGRDRISIFNVARDLRLRVLSVAYDVPARGERWMIRVMTVHRPMADAMGALRLIILVAAPVVIALLVFGGYALTRRWLRPLDLMVAEANRITVDDLGRRLPVVNEHDEVGRLAGVFNVTLERLEASFGALDRFVADASHELRTPLTTLRSVGEVGLRKGRTVEEYREIIASMLEEAQRLERLTQRLLELASTEGGAPVVERTAVRLEEFVAGCAGDLTILAENKNQRLVTEAVACTVQTDPVLLRQALQNLIDNAIKYSPEGTVIRVVVRADGGGWAIEVVDEGAGVGAEDRAQIMARFFRPDAGRGRERGGFGLGLALTKAYMRLLGGTVECEPGATGGSVFRLTLPKE